MCESADCSFVGERRYRTGPSEATVVEAADGRLLWLDSIQLDWCSKNYYGRRPSTRPARGRSRLKFQVSP